MSTRDTFHSLHSLPVSTAILDDAGTIVDVNEAWKTFARLNGLCVPDFGVGANYFDFCPGETQNGGSLAEELKALLEGSRELVTTVYPCHSATEQRWFVLIGLPLSPDRSGGIAVVHADLTNLLPMGGLGTSQKSDGGGTRAASTMAESIELSVSATLGNQLRSMLDMSTEQMSAPHPLADVRSKLSAKQMAVLKLLGQGKSNDEIAKALCRSPHTIKLHVSAILRQLNVKSRTQAAILASKLLLDGG